MNRHIRAQGGRRNRGRPGARSSGFTLIEVAITSAIISTAVLAIVAAQQAYHKQNDTASLHNTALMLANEIRELTLELPFNDPITANATFGPETDEVDVDPFVEVVNYDDLDDFYDSTTDLTFSPPINALRQAIPNMNPWSQVIKVENVSISDISGTALSPTASKELLRVTVHVLHQGPRDATPGEVTQLSWIAEGRLQ